MRWWVLLLTLSVARPAVAVAGSSERLPATILIDAGTGRSLREQDADATRPVGSLSQLMLLLLSLEQSALGVLPLDVPVTVSSAAVSTTAAGSARVPFRPGKTYLLSDLLKAVTIASANDAAVAVAEAIAGSVPASLDLMNARARRLGMEATRYSSVGAMSASEASAPDTTTARDLTRLAQALLQHPPVLEWAALSGVPFDQGSILLRNTNQLLGAVPGVDGLQTSSVRVRQGGSFSVIATARRGALRLVAVVLDAADTSTRYSTAAELLEWGFAHYERIEIIRKGDPINLPIPVLNGVVSQLTPVAGQTLSLLRRRDDERDLQLRYQVPVAVRAPLNRHQEIGEVIVEEKGQLVAVIPILSPAGVAATSVLSAGLP
ncbi:MAG: D-alanyl-D-alanine carboxypeptidase family protein [Candidatus Binatia bacterium]